MGGEDATEGSPSILFSCLSQPSLNKLQLQFNRREHITAILKSLHWLPVHFRVDFNIQLMTFKAMGIVPKYIAELLTP